MNVRSIFLVAAILGLAACQTLEGFGEDVEDGGQAIQNAAES